MKSKHVISLLSALAICLLANRSEASLFVPEPIPGTAFSLSPEARGATLAYQASSQIFTADTAATWALNANFFGPIVARDISGLFSLVAQIDNSGTLHGGSFSFFGQSPSLGITAPTLLLSGNLADVATGAGAGNVVQFFASGLQLNPMLAGDTGPLASAYIDFLAVPGFFNFSGNLSGTTPLDSPIISLMHPLPEPPTGLLFAAGCMLFIALGARKSRLRFDRRSASCRSPQ